MLQSFICVFHYSFLFLFIMRNVQNLSACGALTGLCGVPTGRNVGNVCCRRQDVLSTLHLYYSYYFFKEKNIWWVWCGVDMWKTVVLWALFAPQWSGFPRVYAQILIISFYWQAMLCGVIHRKCCFYRRWCVALPCRVLGTCGQRVDRTSGCQRAGVG